MDDTKAFHLINCGKAGRDRTPIYRDGNLDSDFK